MTENRKRFAYFIFLFAWVAAASASAAVVQQGNLRITLLSQAMPYKLPRTGTAPIGDPRLRSRRPRSIVFPTSAIDLRRAGEPSDHPAR